MRLLLLPGLDGTGRLFADFVAHLPPSWAASIESYPTDEPLEYEALAARIRLPDEEFAIVAESFSGPIALRIAARSPACLRALVLVASFARNPRPGLAWARLFAGLVARASPPRRVLRWFLAGTDAPDPVVDAVSESIRSVAPAVLAMRTRALLRADARAELDRIAVPMLYLAGAHDRVVPRRVVDELRAHRPDIRVATLSAPHLVLQRRPAEAIAEIRSFLGD